MPSIQHEGLIEIVRQHPPVAVEVLRHIGTFAIPARVKAALGSEDMSAVTPRSNERASGGRRPKPDKYTADSVVVVSDPASGERLLAVVVEPQGRAEDDKDLSWPVYVTTARKANKCPRAVLITVCWDEAEAEKCRKIIPVGHPGFVFVPIVVDRKTRFSLAAASPYLTLFVAVIGGVAMETEIGSRQVVEAIIRTGASQADRRTLSDTILGIASDAARKHLEELMAISYRDPFIEGWIRKGEEEGRARGEAEGEARAKAADIVKVLEARGIALTSTQLDTVSGSTDLAELNVWFDRALKATSADEVFAA